MKRVGKPRTAIFQRSQIMMESVTTSGLSAMAFLVGWMFSLPAQVVSGVWWSGLVWLALSMGLSFFALWVTRYLELRRAYPFHFLIGLMYLISTFPFLDATYRIASTGLTASAWVILVGLIVITSSGLILRIGFINTRLRKAQKFNIASRRLDISTGEWNLTAPMWLDSPEATQAYRQKWMVRQGLVPLTGVLTTHILQSIGIWQMPVTFSIWIFFSGCLIVWLGAGKHWGITLRLVRWEQEFGKPILLPVGTN